MNTHRHLHKVHTECTPPWFLCKELCWIFYIFVCFNISDIHFQVIQNNFKLGCWQHSIIHKLKHKAHRMCSCFHPATGKSIHPAWLLEIKQTHNSNIFNNSRYRWWRKMQKWQCMNFAIRKLPYKSKMMQKSLRVEHGGIFNICYLIKFSRWVHSNFSSLKMWHYIEKLISNAWAGCSSAFSALLKNILAFQLWEKRIVKLCCAQSDESELSKCKIIYLSKIIQIRNLKILSIFRNWRAR